VTGALKKERLGGVGGKVREPPNSKKKEGRVPKKGELRGWQGRLLGKFRKRRKEQGLLRRGWGRRGKRDGDSPGWAGRPKKVKRPKKARKEKRAMKKNTR